MVDFIAPPFDTKDASKENESNRRRYFSYWRRPGYTEPGASRSGEKTDSHTMHNYGQRTKLFSDDDFGKGIPLMPVNSGSNVITDAFVDKFATLSSTQYRLLKQWAYGKFVCDDDDAIKFKDERGISMVHPLDRASVGNCVGTPMCPGIEVTWSIRNHHIYSGPYRIKHKEIDDITGLNPYYDETKITSEGKYDGCEPGDLTKRMANPWQSDLFQCNLDHVTFRDDSDEYNKDGKENPDPPTYVAYWWPPSAPWDVISGIETAEEQMDAGWIAAGRQVRYTRGINDIVDMVYGWSYMGFIVNQNDGSDRDLYQYFVEKERNHKEFVIGNVEWVTRKIKIKNKEKKKRIPKFDESFYEPTFSLKRKPPVK
jgi:L-lysine 6-oxidase